MTATPPYVWLGTLPHPTYRLRKAVRLRVDCHPDGQDVMVSSALFGHEWGVGRHMTEAIEDFVVSLCDLYTRLREMDEDELGPLMVTLKARMDRLIEVRG